ncbi:hypothetical protein GobsT_31050 [Gemmata obscuriglobus]|uniref:Uncharacterized protein n=1 Tax=Gemmata obscuriglobus TaxID=114 RepID=A0A2Z3H6Q2_9BACT|nr:hypothetical protein [Gemmata obscuriglobus]AWM38705.1 hypothetical protein C1280_18060 [Gemmata obscuriglobus]QEG28328.1 hypothetical protein GobsT_31050 [Gemmata obscuriglobus]VTS06193.1 unnamed protein product [Gemmata obscuriglobus UQM 2246]
MFGFLRRWWSRDHQRQIFAYFDGTATRRADPMVAGRVLEESCPDYEDRLRVLAHEVPADLAAAMAGTPVAADMKQKKADAVTALVKAADAMFGLRPLDGAAGLTEAERLLVLFRFLAFLQQLAASARPFSISPPRASPSIPLDSPTAPSSASGPVASE